MTGCIPQVERIDRSPIRPNVRLWELTAAFEEARKAQDAAAMKRLDAELREIEAQS